MAFPIPAITALKAKYVCQTFEYAPSTSLDYYRPNDPKSSSRPTLVAFHGGALVMGTRDTLIVDELGAILLDQDWNVISADYRLIPQVSVAAILEDVLTLEKWILSRAEELGIDTNRIAANGPSAGGYIAMLVGAHWKQIQVKAVWNMFGMSELRGDWYTKKHDLVLCPPDVTEEQMKDVMESKEVLTSDMYTRFAFGMWIMRDGIYTDFLLGRHPSQQKIGVVPVPEDEEWKYMPLEFVTESFPPTLITHGDADELVPVRDSEQLVEKLKSVNAKVQADILPGAGHGTFPDPVPMLMKGVEHIVSNVG